MINHKNYERPFLLLCQYFHTSCSVLSYNLLIKLTFSIGMFME